MNKYKNKCEKYVFKDCSDHFQKVIGSFKKKFFKDLIISKSESAAFSDKLIAPSKRIKVNPNYSKLYCKYLIKSMRASSTSIKIYAYEEDCLFFKSDIFLLKNELCWLANTKILKGISKINDKFNKIEIVSNIHSLKTFSNTYSLNEYLNGLR